MLRKSILLFSSAMTVLTIIVISVFTSFSYTVGSPDKCTGSPGDRATCAQNECHEGSAAFKAGLITSDIPATGFIAGTTYTIKATVTGSANSKKFGFQISPQSPTGELLGKMTLISKAETALSGKGKYINQTDLGVDGNVSKSWTFKWTAPSSGEKVTFYGCFLVGGRKELIYSSKLEVSKAK
jgi:hypothetical protein